MIKILILFSFVAFVPTAYSAPKTVFNKKPTVKKPVQKKPVQKLALQVTPKKPVKAERPWSAGVEYSGSTDLLDEREKTYTHAITVSSSYKWNKDWSLGARASVGYESIGREIIKEDDPTDRPGLGDTNISASTQWAINETLKLGTSLSNTFPTSQVSRDEGYKSILTASLALPWAVPRYPITLTNSLAFTYIFNTYDTSVATGTANPEWSMTYTLGAVYKFSKDWSSGVSLMARSTRFLDGFNRFRASNALFVGYNFQNWGAELSYSNGVPDGSNPALDSLNIFQIDQYRQIVGLSLSWSY